MNSQHMLPEKFVNHLHTTRVSNILKNAPHVLHNPRQRVSSIRTAWIRYHQHDRADISTAISTTKSEQLIQKFSEEGLDIWILETTNLSPGDLSLKEMSSFDFIFLEYNGPHNCIEEALLILLQQGQLPPCVILGDESLTECSVNIIEKGTDAFFLTTMDNEVILARCQALLRRCYDVM